MYFLKSFRTTLLSFLAITLASIISLMAMATPVLAETYIVKMGSDTGQLVYVPDNLIIHPGDTVKWVMNKVPPHNVVFDESKIPGADKAVAKSLSHTKLVFSPGDSYSSTFPEDIEPGIYPYYCQPHRGAGMAGKIVVEP